MTNPKRVLVLMSDTGGGHRAAAEALKAAAEERYPDTFSFTLVDVFRYYTPFPFKYAPEIYPLWVNYAGRMWQVSYEMTNAPLRSRISAFFMYLYWRHGIRRMLAEHPADLIVSVHSVISRPVLKALNEQPSRPPFVTVVTDLVSTHGFWYHRTVDRCLVPTETAYQRGLQYGLKPEQLRVTGLPIHPDFLHGLTTRQDARHALGLDSDLPAVLLVSGGEGMGPLFDIADAINQRHLPCQLLIVAGRNQKLQQQLEDHTWHQPTTVYGFVDFMPQLMAAADMLVTKAGPATITEACTAGLPIIISGAVPGQEEGNITFVVENQIGVFAPSPKLVADTVEKWLQDGQDTRQERAKRAKALARPDAVWEIVDELHQISQRHSQHHPLTLSPIFIPSS